MFIGREKELEEMNRLYRQERFHLFILYGRRRVGKTTFLNEFCRDKDSIFFSAEQSNEKMNLEKFSDLIFSHYQEKNLATFASWEKAFSYIHGKQLNKQLVVVLDEFPYIAGISPGLLSTLQHLVDHVLNKGKLFLILCGSYMGFMEKEVLGAKSPLFGRRTGQLHMKPFDYLTSTKMLQNYSDEEKLELYGVFGGTAFYLEQVDNRLTMEENIKNLFLKTTGYLYEEPLLLLRQEVQEPGTYFAILEAIASGASKSNEIATRTGEISAKCLKYMAALRELGLLEKEHPFGEKDSSRKTLYHIPDFMFRFWYRYVAGNRTLIETGASDIVWQRRILPDYPTYMGLVFERICREYLLRKNSQCELPFLFTEIGRWWGTDPATRREEEIDLIAKDQKDYLMCECKWKNQPMQLSVLETLVYRADLAAKNREKTWFFLFSKAGFSDALQHEAKKKDNVVLVGLKDILREDPGRHQ